jgi:hypothetical protein
MTPTQRDIMRRLSPPSSKSGKLVEALRRKFGSPRECLRVLGLDESLLDTTSMAFDQGAPRFSKSRAVAWLRAQGCTEQECDAFLDHLGSGAEAEDEHATSSQHNAMERAAHSDPREKIGAAGDMPGLSQSQRMSVMEADELPDFRGNGMPKPAIRHAMDGLPPRTAACRIAPGLEHIRLGAIGF